MKTITKFISAAFAVLMLGMSAAMVNGAVNGSGPRPTPTPRPVQTPYGWDYNLTHECVTTALEPGSENYYADLADCPVPGEHWQLGVESERDYGQSCPGPPAQSLPINQGGILTVDWQPHIDEFGNHNWRVHLKTDLINYSHPCGDGYFTWYRFGDQTAHFPTPDLTNLRATISYSDSAPNGSDRCFAAWEGYWDGRWHSIEIDFVETNRGYNPELPPDIVVYQSDASSEFVELDGSYFGITIPKDQDVAVSVNFWSLIQDMINRGYFVAPINRNPAEFFTWGLFFGTEVKNESVSNSVMADLYVTNFRPTAVIPRPTPPPHITPVPPPPSPRPTAWPRPTPAPHITPVPPPPSPRPTPMPRP